MKSYGVAPRCSQMFGRISGGRAVTVAVGAGDRQGAGTQTSASWCLGTQQREGSCGVLSWGAAVAAARVLAAARDMS
jgi:hypothetical protein